MQRRQLRLDDLPDDLEVHGEVAVDDAVPGSRDLPDPSVALAPAVLDQIILVVPSPLRPRIAVDSKIALTRIAGLGPSVFGTPETLVGVPGRIIVHDPVAEGEAVAPAFAALEAPDPVIAGVRLIPLLVDPVQRIWVFQVPPGGVPAS